MVPIQRTEKKAQRPRNCNVVNPLSMNWLILSLLHSFPSHFHCVALRPVKVSVSAVLCVKELVRLVIRHGTYDRVFVALLSAISGARAQKYMAARLV